MPEKSRLLENRVALITGSTRGIGRAIAETLAGEGARVVIVSRSEEDARAAAREIADAHGAATLGARCDVGDAGSVAGLFGAIERWSDGVLDVLVNNAGYPMDEALWNTPLHEIDTGDVVPWFDKVWRTDALGAVLCTREALRLMVPRGRGNVVFITSTPALEGYRGTPYTVAKAGVLGLMKDVALEYGPAGVRANALALGNISTAATFESLDEATQKALAAEAPLGRWGEPEEVGRVTLFLASDISSFVTGQTLVVDGGVVRR